MDNEPTLARRLALGAIMLSTVSTGFATFVSFEGAGQELGRAHAQVVRLGQFHRLMSTELRALDCDRGTQLVGRIPGAAPTPSKQESFLRSWQTRHRDIQDAADGVATAENTDRPAAKPVTPGSRD